MADMSGPGIIRLEDKSPPPPYSSQDELVRLATPPPPADDSESEAEDDEPLIRARARFEQNTQELENFRMRFQQVRPSTWKRVALLVFTFMLFWMAFRMRFTFGTPEPVVHANRYSKSFKYRPAASPIITSKLPDGRVKVRGDAVQQALQAERLERLNAPKKDLAVKGARKKSKKAKKSKFKPKKSS